MSLFRDPYAVDECKKLINSYGVNTIVETGTYHGEGIRGFSSLCNNVYSIDNKKEFFEEVTKSLINEGHTLSNDSDDEKHELFNGKKKITLILGDSPKVISKYINEFIEPILFFLDAHGPSPKDYCPIIEEVQSIKPKPNSLIIFHDFFVPGKDFNYDNWNDRALGLELVKYDLDLINPNYKKFYNSEATSDVKYRSGILFVVPEK